DVATPRGACDCEYRETRAELLHIYPLSTSPSGSTRTSRGGKGGRAILGSCARRSKPTKGGTTNARGLLTRFRTVHDSCRTVGLRGGPGPGVRSSDGRRPAVAARGVSDSADTRRPRSRPRGALCT